MKPKPMRWWVTICGGVPVDHPCYSRDECTAYCPKCQVVRCTITIDDPKKKRRRK